MLQKLKDHFIPHKGNKFSPRLFAAESIVVIVALIVILQISFVAHTLVLRHSDYMAAILPGVLVSMTNADRVATGIGVLQTDQLLTKAAQLKANDMATKGYFAHRDPLGRDPWHWLEQVGYEYSYAGENLAVDFTESGEVERAWMNSPAHKANIIKRNFTKIGIGVAKGNYNQRETTFVVQFFATPSPSVVVKDVVTIKKPVATTTSAITKALKSQKIPKTKLAKAKLAKSKKAVNLTKSIKTIKAQTINSKVLGAETGPSDSVSFVESTTTQIDINISDVSTDTKNQDTYDMLVSSIESGNSALHKRFLQMLIAPSMWYMPILLIFFVLLLIALSIAMVVHVGNRRVEGISIAVIVLVGIAALMYANFNPKYTNATMPSDVQYASVIKSISY